MSVSYSKARYNANGHGAHLRTTVVWIYELTIQSEQPSSLSYPPNAVVRLITGVYTSLVSTSTIVRMRVISRRHGSILRKFVQSLLAKTDTTSRDILDARWALPLPFGLSLWLGKAAESAHFLKSSFAPSCVKRDYADFRAKRSTARL